MFVNVLSSYAELLVGVLTSLQECILKFLSMSVCTYITNGEPCFNIV
jgi:hypothetical protein